MKTVDIALDLSAGGAELVTKLAGEGALLHLGDGTGAHVLERVLQVGGIRTREGREQAVQKKERTWRPAMR